MKISVLRKIGEEELKDIQELMNQLSTKPTQYPPLKLRTLELMAKDRNAILMVLRDKKRIIGMATLSIMNHIRGPVGYIDDVIVHSNYRGQGLGEKISREIITLAKKKKLRRIDLTSRPTRVEANKLYQKLGFELRETNPYELKLK